MLWYLRRLTNIVRAKNLELNEQSNKHMKSPKILMAGLLALSTVGVAQAQTVVHITGSTAFRTAVHTSITQILKPGFTYAYVGSSFTGASEAIFTGTAITNSIPVIIKTSWSGSLAGIETVSQAYPSTVSTFLTNTTPQTTGGTSISSTAAVFDGPTIPEVCMNDGYQYDSQYPNPELSGQAVGVVSFKFIKNHNAPADLTNMTSLVAQALWVNGSLPLSLFSGVPADSNTLVFATGRDPDSGTRKTAFLETGVQSFDTALYPTTVLQYEPMNASGQVNKNNAGAITSQVAWPAETVDNISFGTGNAGYSSGGDLATAMGQTSPYVYVTYLGLSDAATAEGLNGGLGTDLTYNGVAFSDAAVENGQYTYWTYEFLSYNYSSSPLAPSANVKAVADYLAQTIQTQDLSYATGLKVGENLSAMHVVRSQEGGIVTP